MSPVRVPTPNRLLAGAIVLVILKVTISVLSGYRDYLPPNFNSDFLFEREAYFYGPYAWAFYTHLLSGPLTLVIGTILVSDRFRHRFPRWHRLLGRLQVACILILLVPSGLWMARYTLTGAIAAAGLACLAVITAVCCLAGWRAAVNRNFANHQLWMSRTYILLCSAVIIRLIGGAALVLEVDASSIYPISTWASWLVPLLVFEGRRLTHPRQAAGVSHPVTLHNPAG